MESRVFKTRSQQPVRAYLAAPERRSRSGGLLPANPALPEAVLTGANLAGRESGIRRLLLN